MADIARKTARNAIKGLRQAGIKRLTWERLAELYEALVRDVLDDERGRTLAFLAGRIAHWEGREAAWEHPEAIEQARRLADECRRLFRAIRDGAHR